MNDVIKNLPSTWRQYVPIIALAMTSPKTNTKYAALIHHAVHGMMLREARGETIDEHAVTAIGVAFGMHCEELLKRGYCPLTNRPHPSNTLEIN